MSKKQNIAVYLTSKDLGSRIEKLEEGDLSTKSKNSLQKKLESQKTVNAKLSWVLEVLLLKHLQAYTTSLMKKKEGGYGGLFWTDWK